MQRHMAISVFATATIIPNHKGMKAYGKPGKAPMYILQLFNDLLWILVVLLNLGGC